MTAAAPAGDPQITNCHIHTFTLDHVPANFLPVVGRLLPGRIFPKTVASALRGVGALTKADRLSRFAAFIEAGALGSQEEVFRQVRGFYPSNTRFVMLPMDMAWMGAGAPRADLEAQHDELAGIARHAVLGPAALPFVAVDPRRDGVNGEPLIDMVKRRFDQTRKDGSRVFRGVKIYPKQGFAPDDCRLKPIWAFCEREGLPVLSHCSRGGIASRYLTRERANAYGDPDRFIELMERHPRLRICLAHMGGLDDWREYFRNPESREDLPIDPNCDRRRRLNWLTKILQMLKARKRFPNLYTDISYTIFETTENIPPLKVFLLDPLVRDRVLFGSDYYMTHIEKFDERRLSMQVRADLGEYLFWTIARHNPRRWLGEV